MMGQLRINFQGCGEVETFSQTRVQPMGNGVQLPLGVARQVRPLGQVLAQQPVRILVGSSLPRRMGIGKEHLNRKVLRQSFVFGHLFPSIVRQRLPQEGGYMPEFLGQALAGTRGIGPVHSGQEDQTCCPLHQGPDSRSIASALEEIAFPVAGHRTGHHLGWMCGNRRHVGDLPRRSVPRARGRRALCA